MKLNNRGFTLIEVLASVVILSLLSIIIVSSVSGLTKKNNIKAYENLKNGIISSSIIYMSDNRGDIVFDGVCIRDTDLVNVNSVGNDTLVDSKILVKYLVNEGDLTTNSNGNIINPLDNSLVLDLNNSYVLVKYQCSIRDYVYQLEDDYLIWK